MREGSRLRLMGGSPCPAGLADYRGTIATFVEGRDMKFTLSTAPYVRISEDWGGSGFRPNTTTNKNL
jgi:hypothetical protein